MKIKTFSFFLFPISIAVSSILVFISRFNFYFIAIETVVFIAVITILIITELILIIIWRYEKSIKTKYFIKIIKKHAEDHGRKPVDESVHYF
jgi:membrane protein YdbS with pleckstrin-like domain